MNGREQRSDLAKTILQGGGMVTAVKHGLPRTVMNNSPFYITVNEVPEFGDDDENVKRPIAVFKTKSLPQYTSSADRWVFDHAMDCISWLANEITEHRDHIDNEDLWYETGNAANQCIIENESGLRFFDVEAVRGEGHNGRFKSKCERSIRDGSVHKRDPRFLQC